MKYKIVVLSSISILIFLMNIVSPPAYILPSSILLFSIIVYIIAIYKKVPPVWPLLGFYMSILFLTLDILIGVAPHSPDSEFFHSLSVTTTYYLEEWTFNPEIYPNTRVQAYSFVVGVYYLTFGINENAAIVMNCAIWGISIVYWIRIKQYLFNGSLFYMGIMLTFYPAAVRYSSSLLREAIVLLTLSLLIYHTILWLDLKKPRYLIYLTGSSISLLIFRPELVPVYFASFIITVFVKSTSGHNVKKRHAVIVSLVLVIYASLINTFRGFVDYAYLNPFRLSRLEIRRASEAARPRSYLEGVEYNSWIDVIFQLPIRVIYLLFSPFPWVVGNYSMLLATIDSIYILVIFVPFIIGFVRMLIVEDETCTFIFAFILIVLSGYGIVISTSGVASRRRMFAVPMMIIISSYTIETYIGEIKLRVNGSQ